MAPHSKNCIKFVFRVTCVSLAVYMTILQAIRYQRNEDVSSLAVKQLNESLQDQYPTISFCFEAWKPDIYCDNGIFDNLVLHEVLNLDYCHFIKMLTGDRKGLKDFDLNNITRLNFEIAAMNYKEVFFQLVATTTENITFFPLCFFYYLEV